MGHRVPQACASSHNVDIGGAGAMRAAECRRVRVREGSCHIDFVGKSQISSFCSFVNLPEMRWPVAIGSTWRIAAAAQPRDRGRPADEKQTTSVCR
jgi:hypothetical protein